MEENLLVGGFLVIAILLLFLGNVRAALVVAATIPLSLLFAAIGMRWLGLSANLMSLGAIDFGMIVDGSVVMTENFVRRLHHDQEEGHLPTGPKALAARLTEVAREVGRPITFGVLIIMLVYMPILTLQGLEGRMFRPMALTVGMALFGSLLLALLFVPAAATFLFRGGARESRYAVRLAGWLDRRYVPALRRTMAHPKATLGVAVAVFAATMLLVPRLGTEFLPELDEGSILIQPTRDPSVSLTHSVEIAGQVEKAVKQIPEVATVVSRVGRPDIGSDPMGVNQSDVFVMLKPRSEWRDAIRGKEDLEEELEEHLEEQVPGVAFGFTQPMKMRLDELISGVRSDLAVKVFGEDAEQNRAVAEQVAAAIGTVPGTSEVQVEQTAGQGYLEVEMDRAALARYGIPIEEVQEALEVAIGRRPVARAVDGAYNIDIVVQYPEAVRSSPEAIGAITVPSPSGALVPLAQLADIRMESGPVQISREQAQRLVIVQGNVRGRDLGSYVADVQEAIRDRVDVPPGVFLTYGGQFENLGTGDAALALRGAGLDRVDRAPALRLAPVLAACPPGAPEPALRCGGRGARALDPGPAPERLGLDRLHRTLRGGGAEWAGAAHHGEKGAGAGCLRRARRGGRIARAAPPGTDDGAGGQHRLHPGRGLDGHRCRGPAAAGDGSDRGARHLHAAHPAGAPHAVCVDRGAGGAARRARGAKSGGSRARDPAGGVRAGQGMPVP